jgi:16S rRNA (uracil1498-N3)-methyltransferase
VRLRRVFIAAPLAPSTTVELEGSAAAHVARVLRLSAGAELTLFNGAGGEFAARIAALGSGSVRVTVGAHAELERESPLELTLAQGIARADRMDLVVQKATELGVTRLLPLACARSVVRLDARQAARKLEHWRAIAIAACEQCGRNRLPELAPPLTLAAYLAAERARPQSAHLRLLLSPAGSKAQRPPSEVARVSVLIGPEGGLTDEEQQGALAAGFEALKLGPRILRTETAALAAVALLQRQYGDL